MFRAHYFLYTYGHLRALHSFPTRRSSDLIFLLARVSMTQNYFEDAIPLLESGIKIAPKRADLHAALGERDRKSTRLNSSHANISYAVFCLKKKKIRTRSRGCRKCARRSTA